ncbi:tetratricopeptide repeat protein [Actinoplanes sp. KI2]|uniref:tetratricopeptide repeat protein n=1 Tax=Actinoplanes sp. KI2 TaxID=2983315 RepID=UPI0021D58BFF|nr:tetratricopeptide repeat protein [Actinoplanes sp. KI2]MCU7722443.1 tetratricopeptide repeat protein [Actinoplanes sp. KI2]
MRTELLLDQAGDLLHRGQAGQAVTMLAPFVGEQPGNVDAWLLLARAHVELGRPAVALDCAQAALRLDPHSVEPLYWVSAAYTATGRHEPAIAAASRACVEDPGNPRLIERHGRALLAAGRLTKAERVLAAGVEFAHYDPGLHVAYGMALFAGGRPLSAREAYGRAVAIDPGYLPAKAQLDLLAEAERRIVDAETLIEVTDEYAESLRVPAGGHRPATAGRGALAHVATVAVAVCLAAVLGLAVLGRLAPGDVPVSLTLGVLCAAGSAACAAALIRRRRPS